MNDYTSYEEKVLKETSLIKCDDEMARQVNETIDEISSVLNGKHLSVAIISLIDRIAFSIIRFPEDHNVQIEDCMEMLKEKINRYYLENQEKLTLQ